MPCPKCGAAVSPYATQCPICGTELAGPQASQPAPAYTPPGPSQPAQIKTSGVAIAALVMGILSILSCGILMLPALVVSIIGIVSTGKGGTKGSGLAIAGLIMSVFSLMFLLPALLFPVFAKGREKGRQAACMVNQQQIAMAMSVYAQDHDMFFPNADTFWQDIKLEKSAVVCPSDSTTDSVMQISYGYNSKLGALALGKVTDMAATLAIADSDNAQGIITSPTDIDQIRHAHGFIAAYVDGHVTRLDENATVKLDP